MTSILLYYIEFSACTTFLIDNLNLYRGTTRVISRWFMDEWYLEACEYDSWSVGTWLSYEYFRKMITNTLILKVII